MKRIVFVCLLALVACGGGAGNGKRPEYKPNAQGAAYELVVVADHKEWDGPVGDTLRAMLGARFPMVNREEPMFTVLRVLPEGFKRLVPRHRNILILKTNTAAVEPTLEMVNDIYAAPQVVITVTASDEASMLNLLGERANDIMLVLENAEQQRDVADAKSHTPPAITELVRSKFGIEMSMGPGYMVRNDADNFLWLSYELPTASQGIVIYSYPFEGSTDLQKESLLRRRNQFVGLIPGENPGSHMSTNADYTELTYKKINDRQWAEMRGFWDVEGDFMGGPYTNYSTLDADNGRIISIDFYVYSPDPRLSQRNYVKQLEHYLYTFSAKL